MSNAENYVNSIITGLQTGEISRLPDGCLQGSSLNLGLATEPAEVEASILRRDPQGFSQITRFRAYLAGKGDTTTASVQQPAKPVQQPAKPAPPKEPEREPTTAERTLQSLRRSLAELNAKMAGR